MGIFQHKHSSGKIDETSDGVQQFFDKYFQELKKRGDKEFSAHVEAATSDFKADLGATLKKADSELKEHIASRIDELLLANTSLMKDSQNAALESINRRMQTIQKENEQFADTLHEQFFTSSKAIKDTQEAALVSMNRSVQSLEQQHSVLAKSLEKSISEQELVLAKVIDDSKSRVTEMGDAQTKALDWLNQSIQALSQQHQQLQATMQKSVADQQAMLVQVFEQNMAKIIEHYLLAALGDQYDLKAQLPSIIKQMEASKQDIADDMKT